MGRRRKEIAAAVDRAVGPRTDAIDDLAELEHLVGREGRLGQEQDKVDRGLDEGGRPGQRLGFAIVGAGLVDHRAGDCDKLLGREIVQQLPLAGGELEGAETQPGNGQAKGPLSQLRRLFRFYEHGMARVADLQLHQKPVEQAVLSQELGPHGHKLEGLCENLENPI